MNIKPFVFALLIFLLAFPLSAQVSWKVLNGPSGLVGRALSVSTNAAVFLIVGNQITLTTDKGQTWQRRDLPAGEWFNFASLLQLPAGTTYAAFDSMLFEYQYPTGEWKNLPAFAGTRQVFADSLHRLWQLAHGGQLSFTTNEGATFTPVLSILWENALVAVHNDAHNLYVEADNVLYHFSSSGQKQLVPLNISNLHIENVAFNPYSGTAFLLTNHYPYPLKRSTDGGFTWTNVDFGPAFPAYPYISQLLFHPAGEVWVVSTSGLLRSADEGQHWTAVDLAGDSLVQGPLPVVGLSGDGQAVYAYQAQCGQQAFYQSLNGGGSWTDLHAQFRHPEVYKIEKDASGVLYAEACRRFRVETSADEGDSWQELTIQTSNGPLYPVSVAIAPNGSLFAAAGEDVYRSTNQGADWEALHFTGFPVYANQRVLAAPDGALYLIRSTFPVYKSTDNGASWSAINLSASFQNFAYGDDAADTLGNLYRIGPSSIYKYDAGLDELQNIEVPGAELLAFTVTKTGRIIAVTSDSDLFFVASLYISDDGGLSFQKVYTLPDWVSSLRLISGPDLVLMKVNGSYYHSLDNGLTWDLYFTSADFPAAQLSLYLSADHYLYISLEGQPIYRSEDKVSATAAPDLPLAGGQLFPNPATSWLYIQPNEPVRGPVEMSIFNVCGQLVAQQTFPENEKAMADVRGLPDGIYGCVLKTTQGRTICSGKFVKAE